MKFALTRKERFQLANLFMHRDLQVSGLPDQKLFNRARLSLGLTPIMDGLMAKGLNPAMLEDPDPKRAFDVSMDSVEYVLKAIGPLPKAGYIVATVGDFFEAIETAKLVGKEPPVDEAIPDWNADEEDWKPKADPVT